MMHRIDRGSIAARTAARVAACILAGLSLVPAHPADDPAARGARCTAALQMASDVQLAAWARNPGPATLATYELTLRRGSVFIAQGYLAGDRDERRAKEALAGARAELQALPEPQLRQVQEACVGEADRLLADAGPVQRWLLERVVRRHSARQRNELVPPAPDANR